MDATPDDNPLICHCMVVEEKTIQEAIAAGAHTVADIQDTTYAGTGCGTCIFDLFRLLREAGHPQAEDPELESL